MGEGAANMDLKTFQAPTMSAALAEVKSSLGPGAVIMHTRTFSRSRWLGLRKREVVEITAGRGSKPNRAQPPARLPQSPQPPTRLLDSAVGQGAAIVGIAREMTGLKTMMKDLLEHANRQRCPEIPQELFEYYSQLIQSQVGQELACELIKSLQRQVRPEHTRQAPFVREKLAELIERMLPSSGPIARTKTAGPHVVALIGPTGVGKTTTIAKLAANLKLKEKHRVGLITIDTYRIAAIDQLRKYAEILGAPLCAVGSPEELSGAIRSMNDCQFILIDTAGRSPNDALKLSELKTFLAAAGPDEVHLVLSSTASESCVELAISRFADVRVDKIIFTKLDEAAHLGVVLNVVHKVNKSLSYITTGQDVPDDIEVGRGRKLAQMILGQSNA
jgi:flagellar biosynthesis protein FlhF